MQIDGAYVAMIQTNMKLTMVEVKMYNESVDSKYELSSMAVKLCIENNSNRQ